jgi:hypothetical protein
MTSREQTPEQRIRSAFSKHGLVPASITVRNFPDETVLIVFVRSQDYDASVALSSAVENELPENHLVVIRRAEDSDKYKNESVKGVSDSRVSRLIELLNERSRTSEQQPSLQFIKDAAENVKVAVTRRHHVVFGRRGVGKTALLLEAKRLVENSQNITIWQNIQVLRGLDPKAAFLTIVKRICEIPDIIYSDRSQRLASKKLSSDIVNRIDKILIRPSRAMSETASLIPDAQRLVSMICSEYGGDLYIFLDDFHYLEMSQQPEFLDLLHGITRDTTAWIKISGIRNQCRLYQNDPALGMQVGHDIAAIYLDITLEEPAKARRFLTGILQTYLPPAGITNRSGIFSNGALDRLVLASAGVPRDFLLLSARSIQLARERVNARTVGTQDVNDAAGEAGAQKLSELEEDAASARGKAQGRVEALNKIRSFAIDEKHFSFFRVAFRDKNEFPDEYSLLQSLMDLRMIHIVKGSLSEAHAVGERSEVYMIDLSEYSGSRLKKNISVIELKGDNLVLRRTDPQGNKLIADTPRKVIQIFRSGPEFELGSLSSLVA